MESDGISQSKHLNRVFKSFMTKIVMSFNITSGPLLRFSCGGGGGAGNCAINYFASATDINSEYPG